MQSLPLLLRRSAVLLARNVSRGRRDRPLTGPTAPPPSYERLYGTHAVLNALRGFAQPVDTATTTTTTAAASSSTSVATASHALGIARVSHPHRRHVSCLYVRDFSIEQAHATDEQQQQHQEAQQSSDAHRRRRLRVIPPRYVAVRRITALAKALAVPVRFVPRRELVQLCGERRNQNVVLEVSSFAPTPLHDAAALFAHDDHSDDGNHNTASTTSTTTTGAQRDVTRARTVLLLDHLLDPVNVGSVLRSAFFFGVDAVVLSRDCVGCTTAVARTSTGALEHMRVYRATQSTRDFVAQTRRGFAATATSAALHVIATTTATTTATATADERSDTPAATTTVVHRLVLLGNEDRGLTHDVVACCTHALHIVSPQRAALRAREAAADAADAVASPAATLVEQRAARERDMLCMRATEVTLNVNTACAIVLSHVMSGSADGTSSSSGCSVQVSALPARDSDDV